MNTSHFCPSCGAANDSSATLCFACQKPLAPTEEDAEVLSLLNGRYRLVMQLGTGGYGAVYKAVDTQTQPECTVAIKQIRLAKLSAEEKIEATDTFNREAQRSCPDIFSLVALANTLLYAACNTTATASATSGATAKGSCTTSCDQRGNGRSGCAIGGWYGLGTLYAPCSC